MYVYYSNIYHIIDPCSSSFCGTTDLCVSKNSNSEAECLCSHAYGKLTSLSNCARKLIDCITIINLTKSHEVNMCLRPFMSYILIESMTRENYIAYLKPETFV